MAKRRKTYQGCDYHHILFQGRHWNKGAAKELRNHPYCGGYIPKFTLHQEIHSKIHDIPTPNEDECKFALKVIDEWLEAGYLQLNHRLDKKISVLADLFRGKCPATTAMLDWQKEVVTKFYEGC